MNIAVVGLGLIGGSLAKAFKTNTSHTVYGYDISEPVLLKAHLLSAIDVTLTPENLGECDVVIIALYPHDTVSYLRQNAANLKPEALVTDCCGVKSFVCGEVRKLLAEHPFTFVGGHPMAGRQYSGFGYSDIELFKDASMILTPYKDVEIATLDTLKKLYLSAGFSRVVVTTPEEHDRIIAYTSQLAHVVSNAYVKSPMAYEHSGFSAGSYRDLTRVAWLNEKMWTELFLLNRENLAGEIEGLIAELGRYAQALRGSDAASMEALLMAGKERKALIDGKEDMQ